MHVMGNTKAESPFYDHSKRAIELADTEVCVLFRRMLAIEYIHFLDSIYEFWKMTHRLRSLVVVN